MGEIRSSGSRWRELLGSGSIQTVVELDMAWNLLREEFLDRDRRGQEMESLMGVQGGW